MLCCVPSAQCPEHERDEQSAAATNNQRKENGKNSAAGVGFMGARQANATANKRPNARNHSATNRDHLQRTGGAMRKSQNAARRFELLVCATINLKTEMHNRSTDDETDNEQLSVMYT